MMSDVITAHISKVRKQKMLDILKYFKMNS